jgi:V/A-type H+-transporting ATPase subunit E
MAIEDITNRIISDSEKTADQIINEAQTSAAKIIAEANTKAQEKILQLLQKSKEELEFEKNKKIVKARINGRNKILQVRQNLLAEAHKKAFKTLIELDKSSYRKLLTDLIKDHVAEGEELIFSKKDFDLGNDIINSLNGDCKNITVCQETRQISGGFISRKEGIETNYSLEALIDNKREEYQPKLVEIMEL